MCLRPWTVASEFSILRATSVSSCAGDAPGSDAVTITVGKSMSGKFWIFIALKLISPVSVSMMNVSAWCIRNPIPAVLLFIMLTLPGLMSMMKSSTAGIGLRMHQAETFIVMLASLAGSDGRAGGCGLDRRRVDDLH